MAESHQPERIIGVLGFGDEFIHSFNTPDHVELFNH